MDGQSTQQSLKSRKYFIIIALALGLMGSLISVYTVNHHWEVQSLGETDAACNISDSLSCDAVASSQYSEFLGFPLGVWGLFYFICLLLLLGLSQRKGKDQSKAALQVYFLLCSVGVLTSIILGALSLFMLGAACPSCMAIYLVTILQGALIFFDRHLFSKVISFKPLFSTLVLLLVPLSVITVTYKYTEPDFTREHGEDDGHNHQPNFLSTVHDIPIATSPFSGLGEDYRKGSDDAKIVIVEFSDFQCPACRRMNNSLKEISADFGDQVQIVYRNFPLDQSCNSKMTSSIHAYACQMAVLARCAGQYGDFWRYHDILFDRQTEVSSAKIKTWAIEVGLNNEQINNCLKSKSILDKINEDISLAEKLNVSATPTLFVNGQKYTGRGIEALRLKIEQTLNNQDHHEN